MDEREGLGEGGLFKIKENAGRLEGRPAYRFQNLILAILAHKADEHLCDKNLAAYLHYTDACAAEAVV